MEVALAEFACAGLAWSVSNRSDARLRPIAVAMWSSVGFLARPELAVLAVGLAWFGSASDRRRTTLIAVISVLATFSLFALRNHVVSGHPLPATFYAKATTTGLGTRVRALLGTPAVFATMPITDATLIVGLGGLLGLRDLLRRAFHASIGSESVHLPAALVVCGWIGAMTACVLVPPVERDVFYFQRYVLPYVSCILVALPTLLQEASDELAGRRTLALTLPLAAAAFVTLWLAMPGRMLRFTNDARNIDDIQVALGRSLGRRTPDQVTWVVDAGASRYWGKSFVVDMMGLNSPEMLDDRRDSYLASHPPSRIEVVETWNALEILSPPQWPARQFSSSTHYTVTHVLAMSRHVVVGCPPGGRGRMAFRGIWTLPVTCAAGH